MKKSFLAIIGILFVAAFVFMFLIMPAYEKVVQLKSHIAQKKAVIVELDKLVSMNDVWRAQIFREKNIIDRINLSLPDGENVPDIILSVRSIVQSSGVVLKSINFPGGTARRSLGSAISGFSVKNVSVEVTGSYSAFKDFLSGLENNIKMFDGRVIDFGESDNPGIFDFIVNFNAYYK